MVPTPVASPLPVLIFQEPEDRRAYTIGAGVYVGSFQGHAAIPSTDAQVRTPPVAFGHSENAPPANGAVIQARGGVDPPEQISRATQFHSFRREFVLPFDGDTRTGRGTGVTPPEPPVTRPLLVAERPTPFFEIQPTLYRPQTATVDVVPAPPAVVFARAESAPIYPGFVLSAIGKPTAVDTTRTVIPPALFRTENARPAEGWLLSIHGGPDPVTGIPSVTPVFFARSENPLPWPGYTATSRGGPAAVTTDPVPPPMMVAKRGEQIPESGSVYSAHAISVWWERPPPPALFGTENARPYTGEAFIGHAYTSVTVQDRTPRPCFAWTEDQRPWPGNVLIAGQQRWQQIIPIISTTPVQLFVIEARPNSGIIPARNNTDIVENRPNSGFVVVVNR